MFKYINYNRKNGTVSFRDINPSEVGPNYETNEHKCDNGQYRIAITEHVFSILYNDEFYDRKSIIERFKDDMIDKMIYDYKNDSIRHFRGVNVLEQYEKYYFNLGVEINKLENILSD